MSLLTVHDLTVRYAGGSHLRSALEAVSFAVDTHDILGVAGPSGSGKTTLARTLLGRLPSGADVSGMIAVRSVDLGAVPQEPLSITPGLTVGAHFSDLLREHGTVDPIDLHGRVRAALHDVGFGHGTARVYDAYPDELSGGERQCVQIARALLHRPRLVVLDDPTASLDVAARGVIIDLIRRINQRRGTAFVLLSHDADLVERAAHRTIHLDHGRVAHVTRGQRAAGPVERVDLSLSRSVSASRYAPVAEVTGAVKAYRGHASSGEVPALRGIELQIERGSALGVMGPSGCGKSTLARCLAGVEEFDAGTVRMDGHDLAALPVPARARHRSQIQLVARDAAFDGRLTALEVVTAPMKARRIGTVAGRRRRALQLLEQLGIHPSRADAASSAFSSGERQRLAIARALAARPRLLILDEVFSGLDIETRSTVASLLLTLQRENGLAVLCLSHDLELLASIAPEIAVMRHGAIVERGTLVRRFTPNRALTA